jgi:toxin YoeB
LTYKILWTPEAQADLKYWQHKNKQVLSRIAELVESIKVDPTTGIGKPEHLKYQNKNSWSRRIDKKHRLVYLIHPDKTVYIIQCRLHYKDH